MPCCPGEHASLSCTPLLQPAQPFGNDTRPKLALQTLHPVHTPNPCISSIEIKTCPGEDGGDLSQPVRAFCSQHGILAPPPPREDATEASLLEPAPTISFPSRERLSACGMACIMAAMLPWRWCLTGACLLPARGMLHWGVTGPISLAHSHTHAQPRVLALS